MPRSLAPPLLLGLLLFSAAASAAAPYLGVTSQGAPKKAGSTVKKTCSSCHGIHGEAAAPAFPNLAGQSYNYLLKELEDFRSGARKASPMSAMIKTVPKSSHDENLRNLAAYFATQKAQAGDTGAHPVAKGTLEQGRRIFQEGIRGEQVPACAACHLQNGTGMAPMAVPALAGQNAKYLIVQLDGFASGKRGNSPHHVMQLIAGRLKEKQIHSVAAYLQVLRPADLPGRGPFSYSAFVKHSHTEPLPGVPGPAVEKQGGQAG